MRRKAGVGAVVKRAEHSHKYRAAGERLSAEQMRALADQLAEFRSKLRVFAEEHRAAIKKEPEFRRHFQQMCAAIGVDPLASAKGFWTVLGIGDFYYELGVQTVEVCLATNHKNGGLIGLDELRTRLIAARGAGVGAGAGAGAAKITDEDILAAIKKLRIFGNGFSVIPVGKGEWLVQSIPGELDMDQTAVLRLLTSSKEASVSVGELRERSGWEEARAEKALDSMVGEGLAWIDAQNPRGKSFWFPSMFKDCVAA